MAESEAAGEAKVDAPVDELADVTVDAGQATASDDFGYLFSDPEVHSDHPEWNQIGDPTQPFDAFNETTWNFRPAPLPWYRTGPAMAAMIAVSLAVVALIVSVVLLAFRGSSDDEVPATDTSTAPTTATTAVTTTLEPPPPPPPAPPPPPPPEAAPQAPQAPVVVRPRPTKKPEINVTRSPISVSPNMPRRP